MLKRINFNRTKLEKFVYLEIVYIHFGIVDGLAGFKRADGEFMLE